MKIIEFDRWKPSADNPQKLEYAGQRTAEEVFEELKHRLEVTGCLPDEYFDLRSQWEDGREIHKDADLFCTVDYGASEGVYMDVHLKWFDEKQQKGVTESFIVGKTLGQNGNNLDRMFLTASAITKAVHGDHATHSRYMKIGGVEEDTGGRVVHLSQQEEKVIISALVEQRERQEESMSQTEQLLRRMTGGITAYMDTVGQRPLRLSDYDKAVLAIREGELNAFLNLYPKLLDAHADSLFVETAGRPGAVGRKMTSFLLDDVERFPESVYTAACRKAIDINDLQKVDTLLKNAADRVEDLSPSFCGEMARYAYRDHPWIAREIVEGCSPEQIAAAPSDLLTYAIRLNDHPTAWKLAEGGIHVDDCFADIAAICKGKGSERMAVDLLQQGAKVSLDNFRALHACIGNDCPELGKFLLDQGMNLDRYKEWAMSQGYGLRCGDTLASLEEHWNELQVRQETGAPIEAQQSGFDGERSRSEMSEPCPQDGANGMELAATMGGMNLG